MAMSSLARSPPGVWVPGTLGHQTDKRLLLHRDAKQLGVLEKNVISYHFFWVCVNKFYLCHKNLILKCLSCCGWFCTEGAGPSLK